MKKVTTDNGQELILTESKTMREGFIENEQNFDILDKIKAIPYLTKDMVVSVEQVANYYEVTKKAIETVISRNREELEEDGIMVLKGDELKNIKEESSLLHSEGELIPKKIGSLTILTKRAMLRIGMLLTTSMVAKQVRTHLLNCEEETSIEKQKWIAQREAGKIDRKRMTTAINNYIPNSPNKRWKYPEYTNLIYSVLFGKDAKKLREERGFTKNDTLRDSFTGEELKNVDEAETIVTALITLGFNKEYIKQQLINKYNINLIAN